MDKAPAYSNPPVREALIDIRIDPLPFSKIELFERLQNQLGSNYSIKKKQQRLSGLFQWQEEAVSTKTSQGITGLQFENAGGTRVIQFQLDGFACNFIKPDPAASWEGWPALRDEARHAWNLYAKALDVTETAGFSVRYINQIVIPTAPIELTDYLTVPPEAPKSFPYQGLHDWLSRVSVSIHDLNAIAIITQAPAEEPTTPDSAKILLDIDIVRRIKAPLDSDAMWAMLDRFRDIKNNLFETSLTDKAKELFR